MNPLPLDSSPSSSSFDLFVRKQQHGVFSEKPARNSNSPSHSNGNKHSPTKPQQKPPSNIITTNYNTQLKKRTLSEMKSFPSNTQLPTNPLTHIPPNTQQNPNANIANINPYKQSKQTENKLKFQTSLKLLDKILYEDEHLIISDSILAPSLPSYAPIEKQTSTTHTNTYSIKTKLSYPEDAYAAFKDTNEHEMCFCEVFPPLDLIYFIKGNLIFFWNYNTKVQSFFNEISEPIHKTHITFPKAQIFTSEVNYIMIVATIPNIYVLLLIVSPKGNIEVHKSDIIYTGNNEIITSIVSTVQRRIFLGSVNNKIWEFEYQNVGGSKLSMLFGFGINKRKAFTIKRAEQSYFESIFPFSFFNSKLKYIYKMEIDNTRHLLYAISHECKEGNDIAINDVNSAVDSKLMVYDLGSDGCSFNKVTEISQDELLRDVRSRIMKVNRDVIPLIVDVVALRRNETKDLQVVVLTRNGFRVYVKFITYVDGTKRISAQCYAYPRGIPEYSYDVEYDGVYYVDKKTFVAYRDKRNGVMNVDVIENDLKKLTRLEGVPMCISTLNEKCSEMITNVYMNDIDRKMYNLISLPMNAFAKECDLCSLVKNNINDNFVYNGMNYIDSEDAHISAGAMHEYIEQLFLGPKEYLMLMSNEVVDVIRFRPIDMLVMEMLRGTNMNLNNNNNNNTSSSLNNSSSNSSKEDIEVFVEEYGLIETYVMLWMIVTNPNFVFYVKAFGRDGNSSMSSMNRFGNNMSALFAKQNPFSNQTNNNTNINNNNNINNSDVYNKYYGVHEIKNNDKIIHKAEEMIIKLLDIQIRNISNTKLNTPTSIFNSPNVMDNNNNNNNNFHMSMNTTNQPPFYHYHHPSMHSSQLGTVSYDKTNQINNFLSYSLYLFISRISRLFWEEPLYISIPVDKTQNAKHSSQCEYMLIESMQNYQIEYIKHIFISFKSKLSSYRNILFQKASDIDIKRSKLINDSKNTQKQYQQHYSYQMSYVSNSFEYSSPYKVNYNFSTFQSDYNNIITLCSKFIELFSFMKMLYSQRNIKSTLEHKSMRDLASLKYKDILLENHPHLLKSLLEELFESILTENDYLTADNTLSQLSSQCPSIINANDIELIKINLILRISKTNSHLNTSDTNQIINRAVKLLLANPQSIKLDKILPVLFHNKSIRQVVELCVAKATHLKEDDAEASSSSVSAENELKYCLYVVLKLFEEIHCAIGNKEYCREQREEKGVCGDIVEMVSGCVGNDEVLNRMKKEVIDTVLAKNTPFVHMILFEHLRNKGMLDELNKTNSPYVEMFFNNEVNKESALPKDYEDLYKFYLNSNNYEAAVKILLQLINFDNTATTNSNDNNNNNNNSDDMSIKSTPTCIYLKSRMKYTKHLLYAITKLIDNSCVISSSSSSPATVDYSTLYHRILSYESTLQIQNDIYDELLSIKRLLLSSEPLSPEQTKHLDEITKSLLVLDQNVFSLTTLYNSFSLPFAMHELNMKIYIQMQISNIAIPQNAPESNISNFFNMVRKKCQSSNNVFIYPHHFMNSFHNIFFTFFAHRTQFNSFCAMLVKNNFTNKFDKAFPFAFFIAEVEHVNEQLLFGDSEGDDYIARSEFGYDVHANVFWFVKYLHDEVKLPWSYIYEQYRKVMSKEEGGVFFGMVVLCVVKEWCNVVDGVVEGKGGQGKRDYVEFVKRKNEIKEVVGDVVEDVKKKEVQLMYSAGKYKKMEQFVKWVDGVVGKMVVKVTKYQNKVNESGNNNNINNNISNNNISNNSNYVDKNGKSIFAN